MELKLFHDTDPAAVLAVLIVPFMELKPMSPGRPVPSTAGLNRTFYGIETESRSSAIPYSPVLIVPFMELKRRDAARPALTRAS